MLRHNRWKPIFAWLPMTVGFVLVMFAQAYIAYRLLGFQGFLGAGGTAVALGIHAAALTLLCGAAMVARFRKGALTVAMVVVAGTVALTAVFGPSGRSLLLGVATALSVWLIGDWMLERLGIDTFRAVPAVSACLGIAVLVLYLQLIGRIGILHATTAGIPVVVLAFAAIFRLKRRGVSASGAEAWRNLSQSRLTAVAAVTLLIQAAWATVYTAAPEIQYDALYAKAWLPAHWVAQGKISTLVEHPVLGLTGFAQVLAIPGHSLGGDGVGRYLQLAAGLALVLTLWSLARRQSIWGPLAALGIGLMPHLIWQTSTAYDDAILTLVAVASAAPLLVAGSDATDKQERRLSIVLGTVAAVLVGMKFHTIVLAVALIGGWAVLGASVSRRATRLALSGISAAIVLGPGLIFRWLDTGNPVFPQFNDIFRSPYFPPINHNWNFPYGPGGLTELLRFPAMITAEPSRYMEAVPPGAFGLAMVILLLLAYTWRGASPSRRAATMAVVIGLVAWWLQLRYARYLLPYVAVCAALAASHAPSGRTIGTRTVHRAVLVIPIASLLWFPSTLASFWSIPERLPWRVSSGLEGEAAYLNRTVPHLRAIEYVNLHALPGDVLTGRVHDRTHLRSDLRLSPAWEIDFRAVTFGLPTGTTAELARTWRYLKVKWALITTEERLTESPSQTVRTLQQYGTLIFAAGGQELYRLDGKRDSRVANCPTTILNQGRCSILPAAASTEVASPSRYTSPVCGGGLYGVAVPPTGRRMSERLVLSFENDPSLSGWTSAALSPTAWTVLYATAPTTSTALHVTLPRGVPNASQITKFTAANACANPGGTPGL